MSDGKMELAESEGKAKAALAFLLDKIVYSDSYGVPQSSFTCCHLCTGGGAPNIKFEHDPECPVLACEEIGDEWWSERQEDAEEVALLRASASAASPEREEIMKAICDHVVCVHYNDGTTELQDVDVSADAILSLFATPSPAMKAVEGKPISEAPKDGSEQAFDISFKARAFWCDDQKRWVMSFPLHMEYLPSHARYLGPAKVRTDSLTHSSGS